MQMYRRLIILLLGCAIFLGGFATLAQSPPEFDLETGDPLREAIIPRLVPALIAEVSPSLGDVTLVNRVNSITILAMLDALAPYHPTAVGAYTRLERQPEAERTQLNMNIASLRAAYHALTAMIPARAAVWREMLTSAGLDPDDESLDPNSPVGIGNLAGMGAVAARLHDGYNQLGNYADTTGYAPVNSPTELIDAGRWQPDITRRGIGIHVAQQFVTPQMANVEPFGDFDPRQLRVPPPSASDPENWESYKAQVDEVLALSANMTDEQKMLAEIFDNKVVSFGASFQVISRRLGLSVAENVIADFLVMLAIHDATIPTWQEKRRWDAVRPFSAIRHVYGNEMVTAWGGPGMGAVEMPASQWQSYLQEADHPEYPSASSCVCTAQAQAMRRYTGSDELDWTVSFPAGSSRVEPGITPAQDIEVNIATWTDFARICGESRVWAGLHFYPAIEASADMCGAVGDAAYEYFAALIDGSAPERQPAQPLDPDPRMNDRSQ